MANYYKHAFDAQFSFVVVAVFIVSIIAALVIGYLSVRVRPRRYGNGQKEANNGPKPASMKANKMRSVYRRECRKAKRDNTATIEFKSTTFDGIIAALVGFACASIFYKEHYDGMVQFIINNCLGNGDGAAWGDIMAWFFLVFLFAGMSFVGYFVVQLGEYVRASQLANTFLKDGVAPIFAENISALFIIEAIVAYVKECIEEKEARKAAEAKKAENRAAMRKKMANGGIVEYKRRDGKVIEVRHVV